MLESTLFPRVRKAVSVDDYRQLKSKGSEARKKLNLALSLGESMLGMPSWIGAAYEQIAKQDNHVERVTLGIEMAAMSIEFFATDATIDGLEEKARFWLTFVVYTPDSAALHDWLRDHFKMTTYALFEAQQADFEQVDEEDEEEEDDDQGVLAMSIDADVDYEAERREACDPAHDEEFAPEPARSTKLVTLGGGKRGGKTAPAAKGLVQ